MAAAYPGLYSSAASAPAAHVAGAHGAPAGVYNGPFARPVVLPSGFLADTPEVVAVRGAHLTALANAGAFAVATGGGAHDVSDNGQWAADGSYARVGHGADGGRYVGPLAAPVVLPSGFLAETPEVAAAKAAHLSTLAGTAAGVAGAISHVPYATGHGYHHGYAGHGYHHG